MHPAIEQMGIDAKKLLGETSDLKATNSLRQVLAHVNNAHTAHEAGDVAGASGHLNQASHYLQDAAMIHTGKLERGNYNVSPTMLDHAHLGKSHELHQSYVDQINEGKNNGR